MKSMSIEEAREYSTQPSKNLAVDSDGRLYYDIDEEYSFYVKNPLEHRRIVKLTYDILNASPVNSFDEGIVWIYGWHLGVAEMIRPGWRILEDMRRAKGDLRSLDIAPAQYFRQDEFVELHAYLIQIMAWGWPACYLPSGGRFFVEFRSSERAFFYSAEPELLDELHSKLSSWEPAKENPDAARALAVGRYEAAQRCMDEEDLAGAIELYRSSLIADTKFYDAARALIIALRMSGEEAGAASIEYYLDQFTSDLGSIPHEQATATTNTEILALPE